MANASPTRSRQRKRTEKKKGQCRIWMRMRDNRHEKAAQFWSDFRSDMDVGLEVKQLKAAKVRMDNNPKYPGPVGIAIVYFHPQGPDVAGVPIATFDLHQGTTWKHHG